METINFLQSIINSCKSFCENMDFIDNYITNIYNNTFNYGKD